MERLEGVVLRNIIKFLDPEDVVRLGRTSRHMHRMMSEVLTTELWKGPDFRIFGPGGGHWAPELYFDGPILRSTVMELQLSVVWKDQGWGNRKGEIFMTLMRPAAGGGEPKNIAEYRRLFGIAEHLEKAAHNVIGRDHPVVAKAKAGDFYRFMNNAGGGGGHLLEGKNFRVKAKVYAIVH